MRTLSGRKIWAAVLTAVMLVSVFFAFWLPATMRAEAETEAITYDFSDEATRTKLKTYYQLGEGVSDRGTAESFDAHWQVGTEGELTRVNGLGGSASGQYAEVYFDRLFKNFEMDFSIKIPTSENYGWSGVMFGKNDLTASMYHDGDSVFLGSQFSHVYLQGLTVGGNGDPGNFAPFGEGYKADDWNSAKLKVYGNAQERTVEFWLNDTQLLTNVKALAPTEGYVCLFTTAGEASFKDVSFRYLDETGSAVDYVPVASVALDDSIQTAVNVGGKITLAPAVEPANATVKGVTYSTEDSDKVSISADGTVRFLAAGEATVTVSSKDNPALQDSITFTVSDQRGEAITYDFSDPGTVEALVPYYTAIGTAEGAEEEFAAHWKTEEGVLTRINDLSGDMSANCAMLHFDRQFQNFEITYKMRAGNAFGGWVGVMFGKQSYATTMFADGDSHFINVNNGGAFFQGQTLGANSDPGNFLIMGGEQYYPNDWNEVQVRVYGSAEAPRQVVELLVNGQEMLVSEKAVAPANGYVCLFTTAVSADFKDVSFRYLDATGGYIPGEIPAESVSIADTNTDVKVGDEVTLTATVLPAECTMKEVEFSSGDPQIAEVTPAGKVTFLAAGDVTITVKVKAAPAITDEIAFHVTQPEAGLEIVNKISEATVGDELKLQIKLVPEDSAAVYTFTAEPADAAAVDSDGTVHFIKEGSVTIRAALQGGELSDSMTVTVKAKQTDPNAIVYDFTDADTVAGLKPYYTKGSGTEIGTEDTFAAHWQVDEYGVLTRVNDYNTDMAASYAMLHFDRQFQNFEITYKVRASNGAMGWAGVMFGKKAYSTTMYSDGDSAFINVGNGGAFFHGQTLGANDAAGNFAIMTGEQYYPNEWNEVRVKVYGSAEGSPTLTAELWVNGQKILTNNKSSAPVNGYVCLFTTAVSADFKDVSFRYLDENGGYTNHIPAESVTLQETSANVYIGDQVTLKADILPADASTKELSYASSDLSVAIVSESGVVTFINSGSVTISVSVAGVTGVTDSVTFTVAEKLSKIEISNKITEANVGDTFTCSVNVVPGDYQAVFVFTSSDPEIATVSETGEVVFLKPGTVTIKVRTQEFAGIVDSMTVTVGGGEQPSGGGLPGWAIAVIACGSAAVVAAAVAVTVILVKRRKK